MVPHRFENMFKITANNFSNDFGITRSVDTLTGLRLQGVGADLIQILQSEEQSASSLSPGAWPRFSGERFTNQS